MNGLRTICSALAVSLLYASAFLYSNTARKEPILRYRNVMSIKTDRPDLVKVQTAYVIDSPRTNRTFLVVDDPKDGNIFGGSVNLDGWAPYEFGEGIVTVRRDKSGIDLLLVRDGLVGRVGEGSIVDFRAVTDREQSWFEAALTEHPDVGGDALRGYVRKVFSQEAKKRSSRVVKV